MLPVNKEKNVHEEFGEYNVSEYKTSNQYSINIGVVFIYVAIVLFPLRV